MQKLNIYKPYIQKFEKDNMVTLFEGFGGFYINEDQEPELLNKIREFEEETSSLVYAVTHEIFEFGECYSFLCISKYKADWDYSVKITPQGAYLCAYVWNKNNDIYREY